MSIIISNQEIYKNKITALKKAGHDHLYVVADFDKTLTYATYEGKKHASIIALLRDGGYLTPDYPEQAHQLFEKYHPIEIDNALSDQEKARAMHLWWHEHNQLLIDSGLTMRDLKKIATSGALQLRDGVVEFVTLLRTENIPLIIISASGGGEVIPVFLEYNGIDTAGIQFVVNRFIWDESGQAIGVQEPIIHTLNKNETVLDKIPEIKKSIQGRKNCILLGDSLHDIAMLDGAVYDTALTIGFCNTSEADQDTIQSFQNIFDVVVVGDGSVAPITNVLSDI